MNLVLVNNRDHSHITIWMISFVFFCQKERFKTMKNKVKQSSCAALALLLSTSAILAGEPLKQDFRNGLTNSQLAQIPDSLTQSQLPTTGINYWVEKKQANGNTKQVNCNSLMREATGYAQKAYDNHLAYKEGNYIVKDGEVPIFYKGVLEGTISVENGKIVVAFRGTKEGWDWLTNLNGLTGNVGHVYGSTGTVHTGFHQRFMENKNVVLDTVQQLINKLGKDTEILVTGHSLGGAQASLAAAFLKQNLSNKANISLVTFNAPRVFSEKTAMDVESLIGKDNMLRVWRDKDPVSIAALGALGYKHAGHSIKLDAIDTAYAMNWAGKAVPNHAHKLNTNEAASNDMTFPRAHTGVKDKAGGIYNAVAGSFFGQAASHAYNAAANAKKTAWGYFGY